MLYTLIVIIQLGFGPYTPDPKPTHTTVVPTADGFAVYFRNAGTVKAKHNGDKLSDYVHPLTFDKKHF